MRPDRRNANIGLITALVVLLASITILMNQRPAEVGHTAPPAAMPAQP